MALCLPALVAVALRALTPLARSPCSTGVDATLCLSRFSKAYATNARKRPRGCDEMAGSKEQFIIVDRHRRSMYVSLYVVTLTLTRILRRTISRPFARKRSTFLERVQGPI